VGDVVLIRHVKDQFKKEEPAANEYEIPNEEEEQ
jgi:hypothetical protein